MKKEHFSKTLKSAIKNDIILMAKKEKRFLKLLNNPTDTSFGEIHSILNDFGYELKRVTGSHFIYKRNDKDSETIPIHNKKVKKCHVKKLVKKLSNIFIP